MVFLSFDLILSLSVRFEQREWRVELWVFLLNMPWHQWVALLSVWFISESPELSSPLTAHLPISDPILRCLKWWWLVSSVQSPIYFSLLFPNELQDWFSCWDFGLHPRWPWRGTLWLSVPPKYVPSLRLPHLPFLSPFCAVWQCSLRSLCTPSALCFSRCN